MRREINLVFNANLQMFNTEDVISSPTGNKYSLQLNMYHRGMFPDAIETNQYKNRMQTHMNVREITWAKTHWNIPSTTLIWTRNSDATKITNAVDVSAVYQHYMKFSPALVKLYQEDANERSAYKSK